MAAGGEGDTKLSKPLTVLAGKLRERMAASLLPGEAALSGEELGEAARFVLDAALGRDGNEPAIALSNVTGGRFMRLAVINDDMPFLVDSVAGAVAGEGLTIDQLVHPIVPVERDAAGKLTGIPAEGERRESMIYIETPRIDARDRRNLDWQRLRHAG